MLDQVESNGLGQTDHGSLCGTIDRHQCLPAPARLACHVNHFAAFTMLDHVLCHGLKIEFIQ
jgi:hypothetical protein